MQGSKLGLLAATLLVVGASGCALPHVLPLTGGTTAGPSPYGPWYEQHWATNSVLLAAADQPEDFVEVADDATVEATVAGEDGDLDVQGPDPSLEVSTVGAGEAQEFTDSSPYQFPASSFAPEGAAAPASVEPTLSAPPASPEKQSAPPSSGPIRY